MGKRAEGGPLFVQWRRLLAFLTDMREARVPVAIRKTPARDHAGSPRDFERRDQKKHRGPPSSDE
jgi:hypothetical protein